jgi:hypothetical protein
MKIEQRLISEGISLEATLQPDEYQTPNQALHLTKDSLGRDGASLRTRKISNQA